MQCPPGSMTGTREERNIQRDKEICLRWHSTSAVEPEILATGNPHSHTCLDVERSAFLQHLHWLPDLLLRKVTQAPDDTAEAERANIQAMVRGWDTLYIMMRSRYVSQFIRKTKLLGRRSYHLQEP